VSLKAEIREALDEELPRAPTLESDLSAVLADLRSHRSGTPHRRFRAPLTLIAAGLVIALIGGLILVGRYWRDLNSPPQTVNQTELKNLESRPGLFPTVSPGAECPASPLQLQVPGLAYGDGPMFLTSADSWARGGWGDWVQLNFAFDPGSHGPILLRIRDLKNAQSMVAFAQNPLGPSALIPAGRVLGTDHAYDRELQMRSEAVAQDPRQTLLPNQGPRPSLRVLLGLQTGSSHCIGFQIDGPMFTENFVVPVTPYF